MKTILIFAAALAAAFAACRGPVREAAALWTPRTHIAPVVDSFVSRYGDSPTLELYVDRHAQKLLLFAGEESFIAEERHYFPQDPLAYMLVADRRIDIFSGVESCFMLPGRVDSAYYGPLNGIRDIFLSKGILWVVDTEDGNISVTEKRDHYEYYCTYYPFSSVGMKKCEETTAVEIKRFKPSKWS